MSVFFAHVAQHHVQAIGGMLINILDRLFLCKLISIYEYFFFFGWYCKEYYLDGLLIQEMNIQKNVWNNFVIHFRFIVVIQFSIVQKLVQR
jgi:hypothetical protein